MNEQVLNALIKLLETGGWFSIGGIALWLGLGIVKVSVVLLGLYAVVRLVVKAIVKYQDNLLKFKEASIPMISKEVSKTLMHDLEEYHRSITAILNDIDKHLKDSKKDSKESGTSGI